MSNVGPYYNPSEQTAEEYLATECEHGNTMAECCQPCAEGLPAFEYVEDGAAEGNTQSEN